MTSPSPAIQPHARRQTLGYFALFVYLGLGAAVLGPTLPALAAQTRTPLESMGLLFLTGSAGFTVGTVLGARLFDRVPGHLTLGLAQIFSGVMLVLIPLAPWFWLLLLIVAAKGVADGMINTGGNTLLVWTHGDRAGPYMNGLHFFFGLGAVLSPLLVGRVIEIPGGYRWVFWALALIAGLVSARLLTLRGDPRLARPVDPATGSHAPGTPLLHPVVISAMVFLFFYVGGEIAFGGWVFTYATRLNLATAAGAAYLTSAFWFAFTVGRLLSIPMATRFTPQAIVLTALAGALACLAAVMAVPGSSLVLWAVALGLGFCLAPIYATGFTLAGQSLQLTARVSGVILLGDSLGGMVLPWLVGPLIGRAGPRALMVLVFASLVCCALAFGVMVRSRRVRA